MSLSLANLLVERRAATHPVAWVERGQTSHLVTWADFRSRVEILSCALAARPEKSWLLTSAEPFDFAIALFALWHAGCRAVLPPSLQEGAIADIRDQADGILERVSEWAGDGGTPSGRTLSPLDPVGVGVDLFTSGSSGQPKRVSKSLAQLDAEVAALEGLWGDDARGPVLATVPHYHIYGLLFRLLWPLAAGRPLDNQTCAAPEHLLSRLQQLGPGWIVSSPSQLTRMHELIPLENMAGHATRVFSSGGPLDAATAGRFRDALGHAPLEILGSTETGGIAWRRRLAVQDDAWRPLPKVTVSVSADGAMKVRSPFLPDGHALTTHDAVSMLADGRFHLLGRLDRTVKIEEKRLSLPDMEARLAEHPWVCEAALAVLGGRRQSLGALLVLSKEGRQALADKGRAVIAQTLRRHLVRWFDGVLLPRHWRYPERLPFNERGKLAASDLLRHFETSESTP